MFYSIFALVLEVCVSLIGGACLLRLYMQYQSIPLSERSGNPLARLIFALSNWLVLPLRRVVPAIGRWDTASLLGAYLLELARFALLWLFAAIGGNPVAVAVVALFGMLQLALSVMTGLVIVYAVLSWVQTRTVASDFIERLVIPLLSPVRRLVPLVGGVDLSPLVLIVLLQIGNMVLNHAQVQVLLML